MINANPCFQVIKGMRSVLCQKIAAFCLAILPIMVFPLRHGEAHATDTLRIAAQKAGTFAWELQIIKDHGLGSWPCKKAGLDLEITEFALMDASKIAMMGGSTDIILSDWL